MQISSRFTVAVHIFACIDSFGGERRVTSEFLASSLNINPVNVRKILGQLKAAGLVTVHRGTGGVEIARPPESISLYDIFAAVDSLDGSELFRFHDNPNADCPVGRNIHRVMDGRLAEIQKAMEDEMRSMTLRDVLDDTRSIISAENDGADDAYAVCS